MDGYEVVTQGCGLVDRSESGKLALTGSQAAEMLDGLVTNDVGALQPGDLVGRQAQPRARHERCHACQIVGVVRRV